MVSIENLFYIGTVDNLINKLSKQYYVSMISLYNVIVLVTAETVAKI